jgi:hypothetical protein
MTLGYALEKNMSVSALQPSTILGIKRLAKRFSKEDGVSHSIGLDRASVAAGFSNFKHATRKLASSVGGEKSVPKEIPTFRTYISVLWHDPKKDKKGNLTVIVDLPRPLDDMIAKAKCWHLGSATSFKSSASDRIYGKLTMEYGANPVAEAAYVARQLTFMAATGLRPLEWDHLDCQGPDSLPNIDHVSYWVDQATGIEVCVSEPSGKQYDFEYTEWAERKKHVVCFPTWKGIYKPGFCHMVVVGLEEHANEIKRMVKAIDELPWPLTEYNFKDSANYIVDADFISPEEGRAGRKRAIRP